MRTIILSDHTADLLLQQEDQRAALQRARWDDYQKRLHLHEEKTASAGKALRLAWDSYGFSYRVILPLYRWQAARRATKPTAPPPIDYRPTQQESKWNAGNQGENLVHRHLHGQLGDEWALFKGYRNSKGEIDFVAVGPPGIVAIEVKHRNGHISCNGDHWWCDKYDNYGNLVQRDVPVRDKGGRSPARQLNESADQLQAFLSSRGVNRRVMRIVVLSHPKGRVGFCKNLTVDGLFRTDHLDLRSLQYPGNAMDDAELAKVVGLIQRDHLHHNERRQ